MSDRTETEDLAVTGNSSLTKREREVAQLTMRGLRNKAIACELSLCEGTVKIHLHNIFRKLRVRSRAALSATRLDGVIAD
jgi:DNA-binding NarL/FixJ family response regulator